MGPRLKRWLAFLAILLLLGFAGTTCISRALKDDPPPEDDDLWFVRAEVPDAENGFRFVSQFAAQEEPQVETTGEEDDAAAERQDRILRLRDGEVDEKTWDLKLAVEILEKEKSRLETFDKCVASPRFQVPELTIINADDGYPMECRETAELASLRAWSLFKQGKEKEALDAALALVRFGHQLEGCQGRISYYLGGAAIKMVGFDRIRGMLPAIALKPDALGGYIAELGKYYQSKEALVDALKLEYSLHADWIDEMALGTPQTLQFVEVSPLLIKAGWSLKPNKTKLLQAEYYRLWIRNAERSYSAMDFGLSGSGGAAFFSQNCLGNRLLLRQRQELPGDFSEICSEKASLAATQLLIALKCYRIKNGKLPASLNDLVPEYFSAVPKDPFDGGEMKYSAEEKTISTAGPGNITFKIEP